MSAELLTMYIYRGLRLQTEQFLQLYATRTKNVLIKLAINTIFRKIAALKIILNITCDDVDAVEICTPNYLHVPMVIDAVKAGKPINVEKPLSINLSEAKKLEDALKNNTVPNMMCFSYRFKPAVRYAKEILNRKLLGDILSVNVEYLKSSAFMEGRRLDWRFVKEYAGTGVLGDLGVHLIDMAQFLLGDMTRVCAEAGIIVKQRKKLDSDELGNVETDDYCNFMADFECGAHGMFTITRCAIGHKNTINMIFTERRAFCHST